MGILAIASLLFSILMVLVGAVHTAVFVSWYVEYGLKDAEHYIFPLLLVPVGLINLIFFSFLIYGTAKENDTYWNSWVMFAPIFFAVNIILTYAATASVTLSAFTIPL